MLPKCPAEQEISLGPKNVLENGINFSTELAIFESSSLW